MIGEVLLVLAIAVVFVVIVTKVAFADRLRKASQLSGKFILLSADVGGEKGVTYKNDWVASKPDMVFMDKNTIVCTEKKSRAFEGHVRWHELFQVTLYGGVLLEKYPRRDIELRIKYADELVSVRYSAALYRALEEVSDELRDARRNWRPVNEWPLQRRHKLPRRVPYKKVEVGAHEA